MAWWRHQMEIFSALLAICAGNSPVSGEFPTQRPVTRNFDVYFDLRPNERLSKQWWGWWFETLSRSFWRHRNGLWSFAGPRLGRRQIQPQKRHSIPSNFTDIEPNGSLNIILWHVTLSLHRVITFRQKTNKKQQNMILNICPCTFVASYERSNQNLTSRWVLAVAWSMQTWIS